MGGRGRVVSARGAPAAGGWPAGRAAQTAVRPCSAAFRSPRARCV